MTEPNHTVMTYEQFKELLFEYDEQDFVSTVEDYLNQHCSVKELRMIEVPVKVYDMSYTDYELDDILDNGLDTVEYELELLDKYENPVPDKVQNTKYVCYLMDGSNMSFKTEEELIKFVYDYLKDNDQIEVWYKLIPKQLLDYLIQLRYVPNMSNDQYNYLISDTARIIDYFNYFDAVISSNNKPIMFSANIVNCMYHGINESNLAEKYDMYVEFMKKYNSFI